MKKTLLNDSSRAGVLWAVFWLLAAGVLHDGADPENESIPNQTNAQSVVTVNVTPSQPGPSSDAVDEPPPKVKDASAIEHAEDAAPRRGQSTIGARTPEIGPPPEDPTNNRLGGATEADSSQPSQTYSTAPFWRFHMSWAALAATAFVFVTGCVLVRGHPRLIIFASCEGILLIMVAATVQISWRFLGAGDVVHAVPVSLCSLGLLWLGSRYVYFKYCEFIFSMEHKKDHECTPLPMQKAVMDSVREVMHVDVPQWPLVITLDGGWGSGKSTITQLLKQDLEAAPLADGKEIVTVYFDAWQHCGHPDIEAELFHCISRDVNVLRFGAWRMRPFFRTMWEVCLKWITTTFRSIKISNVEFKLNDHYPTPPIRFREQLRRISAALHRKNVRMVLIIDEVDRCDPLTVQIMLSLVRRFLCVPNLTVILPYVKNQMVLKSVHPLRCKLRDLQSTVSAIIESELVPQDVAERRRFFAPLTRRSDKSPSRGDDSHAVNGNDEGGSTDMSPADREERLDLVLQTAYLIADPLKREQLDGLFLEKYFSFIRVPISDPATDDVKTLMQQTEQITLILTNSYHLTPTERMTLAEFAAERWHDIVNARRYGVELPGIRKILESLTSFLSDFVRKTESIPTDVVSRMDLAKLAVSMALSDTLRIH